MSRTCGPDGSWTSTAPTCDRTLSLAFITFVSLAMIMYVTSGYRCLYKQYYSCELIMITSVVIRSPFNIIFPAVDCGPLTNPDNGHVISPDETTFNNVAHYSCNVGFILRGMPNSTCDANEIWTPDAPTCDRKSASDGLTVVSFPFN